MISPGGTPRQPPASPAKKTWTVSTLTYTSGGLIVLFCWLLFGDFAWSMRDRSVGPMAQWYLNSLHVPDLLFGLLLASFPSLIALVITPIISVKSDNHRGRWGRRIPFLLITTPIGAIGMIGLALTPWLAERLQGHFPGQSEMTVSVVCFGVFWAAFELATVAGGAVFGGLINDVVPREFLGRFYGLFRAVSLIDGIIFNHWIMGKVSLHFTLILIAIAIFYGLSFLWVCLKVKEGHYPPPPPPKVDASRGQGIDFVRSAERYFKECFSIPFYVLLFVMLMMAGLAFLPINTFSIPYATHLRMDMDKYGNCLALTYAISLALSWPLGWLSDRFHPLRVSFASLAAYAVVSLLGWLFAANPNAFMVVFVAHGVISGCFFTSSASIGQRLFPHEKYAQYASAAAMVLAVGSIGAPPLIGLLIDWTGHVYRHAFGLGFIFAAIACVLWLVVYRRFLAYGGDENYIAPE